MSSYPTFPSSFDDFETRVHAKLLTLLPCVQGTAASPCTGGVGKLDEPGQCAVTSIDKCRSLLKGSDPQSSR